MAHMEKPIEDFLKIVLAISRLTGERTGIDPLLSRSIYSYGVEEPDWNWKEIGLSVDRLAKSLSIFPQERVEFVTDFLRAFEIMVKEGLGEEIPFTERVKAYLQVSADFIPDSVVDGLRTELQQKLVDAGYPDDLSLGFKKWSQDQTIPDADLQNQGQLLLAEARLRTNQRVMQDPPEHEIELSFPKNYPYNGYSDYTKGYRGRIYLNGDIPYRFSYLKHLVCHEAIPGHQLFSALREYNYHHNSLAVEGTVYLANTPITPIVEGTCELGQRMLGMDDTQHDQIEDLYNRYSSAISNNLAIACNADRMDKETATKRMMESIFVDQNTALRRHAFFTNPLWKTSFLHYWHGREMMREYYSRMQDHLPELYQMIYTEPHTVRTLRNRIDLFLDKHTHAAP
jgi:hypothetical protein